MDVEELDQEIARLSQANDHLRACLEINTQMLKDAATEREEIMAEKNREKMEQIYRNIVHNDIRRSLERQGATGLVNKAEGCGCGLDDLFPCRENVDGCEPAYAVLCDGTNCQDCEVSTYPLPANVEAVCFMSVDLLDSGEKIE